MREPPGPLWGRAASCCLLPRQISGRREACPPARRPRRELRSARRLEARPGPAGLAAASNRSGCLCVAWPGPAAAHAYRSQALSASWADCLKPLSFFGCSGVAGFNGRFLGASSGAGGFMLACISGCRGVIGFKVGTWPCPVREKVRPARPGVDVSAKKFAQRTKNGSKSAFSGVLGEFFRGNAAGGGVLGEFFRGNADGGGVLGCNSGAGSRRIPPRIASPYHERPASHTDAPRPR